MSNIQEWIKLGNKNAWIREADDPPFGENSFSEAETIDELSELLYQGNWSVGQSFYYKNLCFINQAQGGDEFLVIRDSIVFESISARSLIKSGDFDDFVNDSLAATEFQLKNLSYRVREDIPAETLTNDELDFFMPDKFAALSEESESKAEIERATGGPIFAVNTLLEDVYLTKELYEDILNGYQSKRNALSRDGLEDLVNLVLSNATVFRTVYKTLCEGFNDNVVYISAKTQKKLPSPDALIAEYESGDALTFVTIVEGETIIGHVHIVFFTDEGKLIADTQRLSADETEVIWRGQKKDGGDM